MFTNNIFTTAHRTGRFRTEGFGIMVNRGNIYWTRSISPEPVIILPKNTKKPAAERVEWNFLRRARAHSDLHLSSSAWHQPPLNDRSEIWTRSQNKGNKRKSAEFCQRKKLPRDLKNWPEIEIEDHVKKEELWSRKLGWFSKNQRNWTRNSKGT